MIKSLQRSNIRFKLIVSLLSLVFLMATLFIIIGVKLLNKNVINEAYESIRTSLAAAQELYQEEISKRSKIIEHLAGTTDIAKATAEGDRAALYDRLVRIKREFGFDIVNVVDAEGRVLVRANDFESRGESMSHYRTIQEVSKTGKPAAGTGVLDFASIRNEGPAVAERTIIPTVSTPHARPPSATEETRAMVIKTAAPILMNGRMTGILYAAVLLNNNDEFIDRFKRLVFKDEKIKGRDVGGTTIFLGDVRIATNVKDRQGRRAVGTLVSDEVFRQVVQKRETRLGKAFVVDSWYLSGYTPILDIDRDVLGILYVGVLKEKYDAILRSATLSYLLVILVTTLITLALAGYLISIYTKPVERIISASSEMALGFYHRIETDPHDGEDVRNLSRAFNAMVDAIQERDVRLNDLAEKTILKSEKLASLGRLASGIAHEINNPLTGVLTYSSLLLDEMKGTKYEEDLKTIRDETIRCRTIVRGILDFARDNKPEKVSSDINAVIEEGLRILEKHVSFQNIEIIKRLDRSIPPVSMDGAQIRTVINNLALNAADAMPNGGRLVIKTGMEKGSGMIFISVTDTGIGISPENMPKIFEPFFTTKDKGKGTGLGLAMTYGVIKRHNGTIDVKSEIGKGTEFIIRLPRT